LGLFRETGHVVGTASVLDSLGFLALEQGDHARAVALLRDSLALRWAHGDKWGLPICFDVLAAAAQRAGTAETAARLFGAAESLRETLGVPVDTALRNAYERGVASTREALGAEAFAAAWAAGRALPLARAVAEAMAVEAEPPRAESGGQAQQITSHGLTRREVDVLRLLAEGRSDREIAAALFISPKTAGVHVSHLLAKLGVRSRSAAVAYALRRGLV